MKKKRNNQSKQKISVTRVLLFPGGPPGQVGRGRRHPASGAQRDGHHVLVTAAGQAGQQCQGDPVLHGNCSHTHPSPPKQEVDFLFVRFSSLRSLYLIFFQDLVSLCNFHNYDNLRHFAKKLDPRREGGDQRVGLHPLLRTYTQQREWSRSYKI